MHLSAAAQIGGVLEPVGALPVIVEDDVLIGGNCGVYEGAIVKRRAVLAAGTIITGSTPVYDLPNDRIIEPVAGQPVIVPEGAVVVPGSRAGHSGRGREWGLSLATPVIVKYRDERTSARTALEAWIRLDGCRVRARARSTSIRPRAESRQRGSGCAARSRGSATRVERQPVGDGRFNVFARLDQPLSGLLDAFRLRAAVLSERVRGGRTVRPWLVRCEGDSRGAGCGGGTAACVR